MENEMGDNNIIGETVRTFSIYLLIVKTIVAISALLFIIQFYKLPFIVSICLSCSFLSIICFGYCYSILGYLNGVTHGTRMAGTMFQNNLFDKHPEIKNMEIYEKLIAVLDKEDKADGKSN